MRTITLIEFMSLDGVVQAPGGPDEDRSGGFSYGGWSAPYFDQFAGEVMQQQMALEQVELLLGRATYEIFAGYWPDHARDWPGINRVKKHVVSGNPALALGWENSALISGDVVAQLRALKASGGPELRVWGSSGLAQTLLQQDLVDRLWLKIFPLLLGGGKRLFGAGTRPAAFTLSSSQVSPQGVIVANYQRAGEVITGSF